VFADWVAAQDSIESRYLKNVRQVTSGFLKAGEGYFSPDGKTIIYQAVPKDYPFYQIYTQPLDAPAGTPPRRVSTGRGRTTCSYFSPDGKKILYASSHLDPHLDATEAEERRQQEADRKAGVRRRYSWAFDAHTDIFEANPDGSNLSQLTKEKGYDAEGAYSPDGKQIVFCSDRDGDPDLYVMNADGSGVRQLTDAPGYDGGPFVSPNGKWVVFRSDRRQAERLQIYVIGIDGKNEVALTNDLNYVNWAPYWHPKQPYLIWGGADHSDPKARPNYDLSLMKYSIVDGRFAPGPVVRITDHASADVLPVFSPDGKKLMWTASRTSDRASQLFIADIDAAQVEKELTSKESRNGGK
jgi:Tol biopolymer transport system component